MDHRRIPIWKKNNVIDSSDSSDSDTDDNDNRTTTPPAPAASKSKQSGVSFALNKDDHVVVIKGEYKKLQGHITKKPSPQKAYLKLSDGTVHQLYISFLLITMLCWNTCW